MEWVVWCCSCSKYWNLFLCGPVTLAPGQYTRLWQAWKGERVVKIYFVEWVVVWCCSCCSCSKYWDTFLLVTLAPGQYSLLWQAWNLKGWWRYISWNGLLSGVAAALNLSLKPPAPQLLEPQHKFQNFLKHMALMIFDQKIIWRMWLRRLQAPVDLGSCRHKIFARFWGRGFASSNGKVPYKLHMFFTKVAAEYIVGQRLYCCHRIHHPLLSGMLYAWSQMVL